MNRYPIWKYIIIAISLLVAFLYTLPNFFDEVPAVQVSSGRTTVKVSNATLDAVRSALEGAQLAPQRLTHEGNSVWARFATPDEQLKAKDAIERALNPTPAEPDYIVALNMVTRSPAWLAAINAKPMYRGLDLRGGVHFLLQVDMRAAITKRLDTMTNDIRVALREKDVRHGGISREGDAIEVRARDAETLAQAQRVITSTQPDMDVQVLEGQPPRLRLTFKPQALLAVQGEAVKQNVATLHNRVNELGVAEPVIQQQGADRVVVQLPGVQDTAKAKDILGRTATLEMRLVDESAEARAAEAGGAVPFGSEKFFDREGRPIVLKRQVIITGDSLSNAQPGYDQNQSPSVDLTVNSKGGAVMRHVSAENINKRMAIILFEKGKGEVLTAPVIRGELGTRFQISGAMTAEEAADLALLLRAGSLAAPMEIIEERTIGPSLGEENIRKGMNSVAWGFAAVVVFMCLYYHVFGVISAIALSFNLMLLVAILSMLQATLTLPGMAAMALTMGMAIDANVLINERIREELRSGSAPQTAIHLGYDRAWATILDSNITSLLAGIALLTFGSGPVRGFAVVHCIGILTSMYSGVFFSRGLVNWIYGRRQRLKNISIGTVWKPGQETAAPAVTAGE